jgi:hypothetical protein
MDVEARANATERIKDAYINRRTAFQPTWRCTPRWEAFWGRVADMLDKEGIDDVTGYVEAQFETVKPFPQPNMIHSVRAVMNYRDWMRRRGQGKVSTEWELEVKAEISRVKSRVDVFGEASAKELAMDPSEPLSPLMRVCLLRRLDPGCPLPEQWLLGARQIARVQTAVNAYTDAKLLSPELIGELLGT